MRALDSTVEEIAVSGFSVVSDLISKDRLKQAQEDADRLLESTPMPMPGVDEPVYGRMAKSYFPKSRSFDDLLCHPTLLEIARRVLVPNGKSIFRRESGGVQLSTTMIKDVQPREARRHFHRDDDFYPIARPRPPLILNTLLALDDFTLETGATWLVPGSHKWTKPVSQDTEYEVAEMNAGSILLFDGSCWHNNGSNLTYDKCRRALNIYYSQGWLRQIEGPYLGLSKEQLSELPTKLREIV